MSASTKRTKTRTRPRKLKTHTICLLGASFTAATGAIAQLAEPQAPLRFRTNYLGYAASVSPRASYSDNINLAPDEFKEDEAILSTLFTGSAIFSTPRFTGLFQGDLDFSYLVENDDFRVNQNIGGLTTFTAIDDWLYLDIAGRTSRQLVGDNARFSSNINAARDQQADVHNYSVSPYLYRELPNQATAELRYRFSQTYINDSGTFANPGVSDLLNDSYSHEFLAAYQSGTLAERLQFTLTGYATETVEDGSSIVPRFEYRQGTLSAEGQYALSSRFALSGAIGYDEIDTDTEVPIFDDSALSGLFWRAGFTVAPGRRTQLRLEYGRRYDDDFIDAELQYRFSERYTLQAGATRSFQTRTQAVNTQFRNLTLDTLEFADRLRAGEELSPGALIDAVAQVNFNGFNAQQVGIGVSNDAFVILNGAFDQTNVSLGANYSNSDFGFTQNETATATLGLSRRVARRLNAYSDGFYRQANADVDTAACFANPELFGIFPDVDPMTACDQIAINNSRTHTVGARIGASYQLYENLAIFTEYSHSRRFSQVDELEYTENNVTAGLTLDF